MKFKKVFTLSFLFILLLNIILPNTNITKAEDVNPRKVDLKDYVLPINTVEAGNGFEDLDKLEDILKDKKIIAMGEATHGTKEFFQMKHRMFEFLVEKMNYRLFGIEASFGSAQVVNDYILNNKGNAYDAVRAMHFWTWSTEEVITMIEWMKSYNENSEHKTKIKFYGFDMQSSKECEARVCDYLKKVDNESLIKFKNILQKINDTNNLLSKDELINAKKEVEGFKTIFDKNKDNYIAQSSKSEYKLIYQNLNIIIQCLDYKTTFRDNDWIKSCNTRDYYMAQNVKWILDYEKQFGNDKIMLWAHNGHVTKKIANYTSMGENLKKLFNDELYVIGFDFYKGSFRANPMGLDFKTIVNERAKFTIDAPKALNIFASSFNDTKLPLCFMDFNSASKNKDIKSWLSEHQFIHQIEAISTGYLCLSVTPIIPLDCYDGIIFIRETSAAKGIAGSETKILDGNSFVEAYNIKLTLTY